LSAHSTIMFSERSHCNWREFWFKHKSPEMMINCESIYDYEYERKKICFLEILHCYWYWCVCLQKTDLSLFWWSL